MSLWRTNLQVPAAHGDFLSDVFQKKRKSYRSCERCSDWNSFFSTPTYSHICKEPVLLASNSTWPYKRAQRGFSDQQDLWICHICRNIPPTHSTYLPNEWPHTPKVRQGHYCQLSQWYSTATSLCEKCPSATVLFQAPQTWSTLWTCCSFPTAKTNLRTAIDALIFWSVGFQGLNYRLFKRVRTLHTRLRSICGTSAALRVRAGSLQGIYIHCELDGICCCLRAQVVETCLQTKFPSVEVHGWQLRSAGVHHVDIPRS